MATRRAGRTPAGSPDPGGLPHRYIVKALIPIGFALLLLQSIAAAIPQCVQIAVDYAGQIAGKLAALLSSGENLMKLIDGALGILKIVKQLMTFIGEQSQGGGTPSGQSSGQPSSKQSTEDLA